MEALIAILAGGRGERVGGEKASVDLGGRSLIHHPISAAVETGAPVRVFAKEETALPPLEVPIFREPSVPQHPLTGVVSALEAADGAPVLVVAGDLPFVTPDLLAWLASRPESLVIPQLGDRLHPLLGRYGAELTGALRAARDHEAPMQETVRKLGPRLVGKAELGRFGDPARLLFNVNTAEDLAEAERLLRAG